MDPARVHMIPNESNPRDLYYLYTIENNSNDAVLTEVLNSLFVQYTFWRLFSSKLYKQKT